MGQGHAVRPARAGHQHDVASRAPNPVRLEDPLKSRQQHAVAKLRPAMRAVKARRKRNCFIQLESCYSPPDMQVGIFGAGAIGSYLGIQLSAAGIPTVLLRRNRPGPDEVFKPLLLPASKPRRARTWSSPTIRPRLRRSTYAWSP